MNMMRAVPRYPQMVIPTTQDYAAWIADGQKGVFGLIDIADNPLGRGYIQPDDFPDERIYFNYEKWPLNDRRKLVGHRVVFDIPPTEYDPFKKAQAVNVGLM